MKRISQFFLILACFCCLGLRQLKADEENAYHFQGVHFLASYSDCNVDALSNVEALSAIMHDAVEKCGATILSSSSWVFPPDGITMVLLLSESHASIHTYPEHGACFVDLFTCGEKCSAEVFDQVLRDYLHPKVVTKKTLLRNKEMTDRE